MIKCRLSIIDISKYKNRSNATKKAVIETIEFLTETHYKSARIYGCPFLLKIKKCRIDAMSKI